MATRPSPTTAPQSSPRRSSPLFEALSCRRRRRGGRSCCSALVGSSSSPLGRTKLSYASLSLDRRRALTARAPALKRFGVDRRSEREETDGRTSPVAGQTIGFWESTPTSPLSHLFSLPFEPCPDSYGRCCHKSSRVVVIVTSALLDLCQSTAVALHPFLLRLSSSSTYSFFFFFFSGPRPFIRVGVTTISRGAVSPLAP